jgi:Holliday junction resolvase RusA-like endonuclease
MVGSRMLLSADGRAYYDRLRYAVRQARSLGSIPPEPIDHMIALVAFWSPPDRLRRDGKNLSKATLDGLTKGGLWADDHLVVDERWVKRGVLRPAGRLVLVLRQVEPGELDQVEAQVLGGKTPPER